MSQCIDLCIKIHQICVNKHRYTITSSLTFLYIFDRSGLLCGGDERGVAGVVRRRKTILIHLPLDIIPPGLSEAEAVCRNLR